MPRETDRAARRRARSRWPRLRARGGVAVGLELGATELGACRVGMRDRRAQRIGVDVLRGAANDALGNLLAAQVDIGRAGRVRPRALTARRRRAVQTAIARCGRTAARVVQLPPFRLSIPLQL